MLLPLDIPPGFRLVDSDNAVQGRYTGGNNVRFVAGKPQKIGGYRRFLEDVLTGVPRAAIAWSARSGAYFLGYGTHRRAEVIRGGDTILNITPIIATGTLTNPFTTTNLSTTITVADVAHGRLVADYVNFSGATAVGGVTINGEYEVASVIDADSYTIVHSAAATSGATGGGTVDYEYELGGGTVDGSVGLGWGAGAWGRGTWGTPRAAGSGIAYDIRYWSLDDYGNDLLICPNGGSLYYWDSSTLDRATAVANAPTSIRYMFVTPERYVMALGTTTPMRVEWPDVNDFTDWTPSATNTANARTLQSGSRIVAGAGVADGVSIVWTDTSAYLFQYSGSDFIYDSRLISEECGLIGPHAFAVANGSAFWMSPSGFWQYSGGLSEIPNNDDVNQYVFNHLNRNRVQKIACSFHSDFNEVRWQIVTDSASEPNFYVIYNIESQRWYTGEAERTTMTPYRPADGVQIMTDADGVIYRHDDGLDADDAPLAWELHFGTMVLQNGEMGSDLWGFVPDFERQSGAIELEAFMRDRPNGDIIDTGAATIEEGDAIADLKLGGRHFGFSLSQSVMGGDFRIGLPSVEITAGATRR
jgi:hypothetical protein